MTDEINADSSAELIETSQSVEAGLFSRIGDSRIIKGLLLPFGELSRPNASGNEPIMFSADSLKLPRDPSVVTLNTEHDRFNPIGRAVALEVTDAGVVAEFAIADTDEGDAYLANPVRKLSAEIADMVRDAADATRAIFARLTGAAVVKEGAFASAGLFSLAPDEETEEVTFRTALLNTIQAHADALTDEERTAALAALKALTDTQLSDSAPEEDAEPDTNSSDHPAEDNPKKETADMSDQVVPATSMLASSAAPAQPGVNEVFELIDAARKGNESALMALSDIKITGTGALPAAGVLQPAWAGQLWQGRAYQRKYMPLIRNGVIRALEEKGFVLDQGTALVQPWAGNKTAVPSGTASTSVRSSTFQKWAYAADLAREFFDLPGGSEVIEAFLRGVNESYARVTDVWTLQQIVASATTLVDPDTYPTDYPGVFGQLIQGAEYIEDNGDTPTFAILNQKAWDQYKYTPKDKLPEFISFTFSIGQNASGATVNNIVKGNIGIDDTPAVLVGSAAAAHVNERGGESPIVENALDIANGGVDRLVVGYTQFMADRPQSLVIVGEADV
jgi:hypothetical protein